MHCYIFADCKTDGCSGRNMLAYLQYTRVDFTFALDYPDELFPLPVKCPTCHQTHQYEAKELQTRTFEKRQHPEGWTPLLPSPSVSQEIQAMYVYVGWVCQTPNCKEEIPYKYLGQEPLTKSVNLHIPGQVFVKCRKCGQTHEYSRKRPQNFRYPIPLEQDQRPN